MNKCLVLFVEGATEVEFYNSVIAFARERRANNKFDTYIEIEDVGGIGGFKNRALRKFKMKIKPKYGDDCIFTIALCSDTDVFEFAPKTPVQWKDVEKALLSEGARNVFLVKAEKSIEDWFLHDLDGIRSFLRLKKSTKIKGENGFKKLQCLFKQANKMYYKGMQSNGMIAKLNIEKISHAVKTQISPLYKALGIKL